MTQSGHSFTRRFNSMPMTVTKRETASVEPIFDQIHERKVFAEIKRSKCLWFCIKNLNTLLSSLWIETQSEANFDLRTDEDAFVMKFMVRFLTVIPHP